MALPVLLFLVVTLSFVPVLRSATTVTLTLGTNDNFQTWEGREYAPRSTKLQLCSWFDWEGVNGKTGDYRPMEQAYFDNTATDSALVVTFNVPVGTVLQNARLEFGIKSMSDYAYNDGVGFLFDDSIAKRWGDWDDWDDDEDEKVCKIQYFKEFRSFPTATTYGQYGSKANISWVIGDTTTLYNSNTRIVDKISALGTFNVMFGDDTSIDYARFIYETGDVEQMNITTYSCRQYITSNSLSVGKSIYSDNSTSKIASLVDSTVYPFSYAQYLRTHTADAKSTQSCFQHRIETATRYWLFVPSGLNLSWIHEGKWTALESSAGVVSTDGIKYNVYTKRYEGGRWVVFGPSASTTSQNQPMYFIATGPGSSTTTTPTNPAANCLCSSTGDPHYVTFDSRKYDFYQPGVYHLVKSRDCSFNVQTLTFLYGSTVTVNGIVGIRYFNDTVVLARKKGADGALWTDPPTAYANGQVITSSRTVGGLAVTRVSATEWSIYIAERNFTLRAVEGGSWFHIYASVGDLNYQRTVDGLCGNCDSKGSNDFKYPNCQNAIESTATTLAASVVAQWGLSWAVSAGESFTGTDKNTQSLGAASYAACKAAPLQPVCPDLILTQVGDGVEPIPPSSFYTCNGTSIVPVVNVSIPNNPNITDHDPCEGHDNYDEILERCQTCFQLTKYDIEDCLTDLCLGPDSPTTYTCPIPNETPCPPGSVNHSVSWAGFDWASLGNGVTGHPNGVGSDECVQPFSIPPGWEIAPDGDVTATVAISNKWQTSCMVVSSGKSYPTAQVPMNVNPCFSASLVQRGECFIPNRCSQRILIRRPQKPVCGDGIKTSDEECDDGNLSSGDGCDQNCKVEPEWECYNLTPKTECFHTGPPTDVVGEDPKFTCNMPPEFCQPCPYSASLASAKTCCVCNTPCCD